MELAANVVAVTNFDELSRNSLRFILILISS